MQVDISFRIKLVLLISVANTVVYSTHSLSGWKTALYDVYPWSFLFLCHSVGMGELLYNLQNKRTKLKLPKNKTSIKTKTSAFQTKFYDLYFNSDYSPYKAY